MCNAVLTCHCAIFHFVRCFKPSLIPNKLNLPVTLLPVLLKLSKKKEMK